MAKDVDINGFWLIEENPVTKEGVFPYLGSQIDFSGDLNLEPNKIYNVLRSSSDLETEDAIKSFNGVPFIDEHEMVGDGCTQYDDRPAGGVMLNFRKGNASGVMVADFKIFSESLKDSIESGKKELSLGYRCKYTPSRGVHEGQTYDFTQTDISGNHIALVDKGRMGSDVRVYDSKATVFDSITEINAIQKGESAMTDKEKAAEKRKKIGEALDGICSVEEITAAQDMCDEDKKDDDKKVEDAEVEIEVEKAEDMDKDEDEEKEDKKETAEDQFPAIAAMLASRDALVSKVVPLVGAFDHAPMTAAQVAVYACDKLEIVATADEALPMLKGYLLQAGKKEQFTMDAAVTPSRDVALDAYLKGD